MSKSDPQVNFRMPAGLRARLADAADEHGRTLTAEIVLRLESTFDRAANEPHLPERLDVDDEMQKAIDLRAMEMFQVALDMALERMRDKETIGPMLDKAMRDVAKGTGK